MTSKPVEVRVQITELHYVGWAKIKKMAIDDRPKPMSSPIKTQLRLKMGQNWKYVLKSTHLKKVKLRKALKYLANVYSGSQQKLSKNAKNSVLDAITWHQYYMNGHTAQLEDFLDEKNLNGLPKLINTGGFQLEFVSISGDIITWVACYIFSALIGWNYSIQIGEKIS